MTTEEAKQAFLSEEPVIFDRIEYVKISALIYRKKDGAVRLRLELLDRNLRTTVVTVPERVHLKREEELKC